MTAIRLVRGRRGDRKGQGLAEFALVLPVLIVLLLAIFDIGRLAFAYNDVTNAARSGVRVAIVDQRGTNARDATINQASGIDLRPSDVVVSYLTNDLSAPCPTPFKIGCVARITATFRWQPITPIIGGLVGPMKVTTETAMPIERVFP